MSDTVKKIWTKTAPYFEEAALLLLAGIVVMGLISLGESWSLRTQTIVKTQKLEEIKLPLMKIPSSEALLSLGLGSLFLFLGLLGLGIRDEVIQEIVTWFSMIGGVVFYIIGIVLLLAEKVIPKGG